MSDFTWKGSDPKPPARIVDRLAIQRAKLMYPWCAACGAGPDVGLNGHHVLQKSLGGDDAMSNIVCLCGTGTTRCHGAHHGNPYFVPWSAGSEGKLGAYERRGAEWVNRRVGQTLLHSRQDVIGYLLGRLGESQGRDFLARTYFLSW